MAFEIPTSGLNDQRLVPMLVSLLSSMAGPTAPLPKAGADDQVLLPPDEFLQREAGAP
jgi:hypothetical protein